VAKISLTYNTGLSIVQPCEGNILSENIKIKGEHWSTKLKEYQIKKMSCAIRE